MFLLILEYLLLSYMNKYIHMYVRFNLFNMSKVKKQNVGTYSVSNRNKMLAMYVDKILMY
jgi:hypothetical protein